MYEERALDQRRRRRGDDEWQTRSVGRSSRGTRNAARHGFEPPPLERGAWREWSERARCELGSRGGLQLGKRVLLLKPPQSQLTRRVTFLLSHSLPDDDEISDGLRGLALPSALDSLRRAADAATRAALEGGARLASDGQHAGSVLSTMLEALTQPSQEGPPRLQARPWRHEGERGEPPSRPLHRRSLLRNGPQEARSQERRPGGVVPGVLLGAALGAVAVAVFTVLFNRNKRAAPASQPAAKPVEAEAAPAPVAVPAPTPVRTPSAAGSRGPSPARQRLAAAAAEKASTLARPRAVTPSPAPERPVVAADPVVVVTPPPPVEPPAVAPPPPPPPLVEPPAVEPPPPVVAEVLVAPRVEDLVESIAPVVPEPPVEVQIPAIVVVPPPPPVPVPEPEPAKEAPAEAPAPRRSTGRDVLSALRIRAAAEATQQRNAILARSGVSPRVSSSSASAASPRGDKDYVLEARLAEAELKRQADIAVAAAEARRMAEEHARARLAMLASPAQGTAPPALPSLAPLSSHEHAAEILLRVFHSMAPSQRWAALEMMTPAQGAATMDSMDVAECADSLQHVAPASADALLRALQPQSKAAAVAQLLEQRRMAALSAPIAAPPTHMPLLPVRRERPQPKHSASGVHFSTASVSPVVTPSHVGVRTSAPEPLPLSPLNVATVDAEDPEDVVPVPSAPTSRAPSPTPMQPVAPPPPPPQETAAPKPAPMVRPTVASLAAATKAAQESNARAKALAAVRATKAAAVGERPRGTAAGGATASASRPIPSTPVMSASPRSSDEATNSAAAFAPAVEVPEPSPGAAPLTSPVRLAPARRSALGDSSFGLRRSSGSAAPASSPAAPMQAILPPFTVELCLQNPRVAAAALAAMRPGGAASAVSVVPPDTAGVVMSYMPLETAALVLRVMQPRAAADVLAGRTMRAQAVALEAMGATDAARVLDAIVTTDSAQRASSILAEVSDAACRSILEALPTAALTEVVAALPMPGAGSAAGGSNHSSRAPSPSPGQPFDFAAAAATAKADQAASAAVLAMLKVDADAASSLAADAARLKAAEQQRLAAEQEIIAARQQALADQKRAEEQAAAALANSETAPSAGRSLIRERMKKQFGANL